MAAMTLLPKPAGDWPQFEPVDRYDDTAVERWHREHLLQPRPGQTRRHNPRFCCCLICADGREATGQRPLIPLYARRSLPEVTP